MALQVLLAQAIVPGERRRIVHTPPGVRVYVDPLSNLGQVLTPHGYEPETRAIFEQELKAGDVFLDIGANEGYFTAVGAKLVGKTGKVIAVEPQSAAADLIELNMGLNGFDHVQVLRHAVGENDGAEGTLNRYPALNTGASSIVSRYRFSSLTERFTFITPQTILTSRQLPRFDFVKVDVEGFEHAVVRALLPLVREGKVRKLLLDYHASVLAAQNVDPRGIHGSLISAGMRVKQGDVQVLSSYILYEAAKSR